MLLCCAHIWAALRIWFCHWPFSLGLLLKVEKRLLVGPPRLVPSGMKLMVMAVGFIQALPMAE